MVEEKEHCPQAHGLLFWSLGWWPCLLKCSCPSWHSQLKFVFSRTWVCHGQDRGWVGFTPAPIPTDSQVSVTFFFQLSGPLILPQLLLPRYTCWLNSALMPHWNPELHASCLPTNQSHWCGLDDTGTTREALIFQSPKWRARWYLLPAPSPPCLPIHYIPKPMGTLWLILHPMDFSLERGNPSRFLSNL